MNPEAAKLVRESLVVRGPVRESQNFVLRQPAVALQGNWIERVVGASLDPGSGQDRSVGAASVKSPRTCDLSHSVKARSFVV